MAKDVVVLAGIGTLGVLNGVMWGLLPDYIGFTASLIGSITTGGVIGWFLLGPALYNFGEAQRRRDD